MCEDKPRFKPRCATISEDGSVPFEYNSDPLLHVEERDKSQLHQRINSRQQLRRAAATSIPVSQAVGLRLAARVKCHVGKSPRAVPVGTVCTLVDSRVVSARPLVVCVTACAFIPRICPHHCLGSGHKRDLFRPSVGGLQYLKSIGTCGRPVGGFSSKNTPDTEHVRVAAQPLRYCGLHPRS